MTLLRSTEEILTVVAVLPFGSVRHIYNDGTNAEFTNDFDPLWGSYLAKMKSTPGNHGWANHSTGWDVYHSALYATWGSLHYGSYMLGDWMIVWVNSYEGASLSTSPVPEGAIVLGQTSGPAKTMLNWLDALFLANPGTAKIVVCHTNIWGSGGHGNVSQMQPLWQRLPGNAAIVLNGHTHNDEVQQPRNAAGQVVAFNQGLGAGSGATINVIKALAGNRDALVSTYTPAPTYQTDVSPAKAGVLKLTLSDSGAANPTAILEFKTIDGVNFVNPTITATKIGGGGVGTAPVNTTLPAISDTTPVVGQVLNVTTGIWTGTAPIAYAYQWQASANGTTGWASATGSGNATANYTVVIGDNTAFLRVQVTATNTASLGGVVATTTVTSAVASAPSVPVNTVAPVLTVNSPPLVGDTITTGHGTWSGSPSGYTYTWQRRSPTGTITTISAQTATTYTTTIADLGFQIRSMVIASNGSGAGSVQPSAFSDPVTTPGFGLQPGVHETSGVYSVLVDVTQTSAVGLQAVLDEKNARAQLLVDAAGMASVTITRQHPSGRVWTVRGIELASSVGDQFIAYDYELPIGRECVYVAEAFDSNDDSLGVSVGQPLIWTSYFEYLKDPALPARNMQVLVNQKPDAQFSTPTGVLPVINRPAPITIGDVRQAETGVLTLLTLTLEDSLRVHALTASGHVLLFQSNPISEVGNMYIAISDITETRPTGLRDSPERYWALTYQETDPPVGGISGGFVTYQTILDNEESYLALSTGFSSYLNVLETIGGSDTAAVPDLAWRGA